MVWRESKLFLGVTTLTECGAQRAIAVAQLCFAVSNATEPPTSNWSEGPMSVRGGGGCLALVQRFSLNLFEGVKKQHINVPPIEGSLSLCVPPLRHLED